VLSGREYDDLMDNHRDENQKELNILRTSFLYHNEYFQLETITNVEGCPTFLILETTTALEQKHISLPKFLNVIKEVTKFKPYSTHSLSMHDFKMNW
jgi:hypothetical protein